MPLIFADTTIPQINMYLLLFLSIVGAAGAVAAFRSKGKDIALEAVKSSAQALKDELAAGKERADRLESDRNEYREKLHEEAKRSQLLEIQNTELKVRTDFTPVMEFQQRWYEEQSKTSMKILEVIARVAVLLDKIEPKLNV